MGKDPGWCGPREVVGMARDRPGIMVYFDTLKSFKRLSFENAGRLIVAMLEYGERGTEPNFSDSEALDMAWSFMRPKIDRDNESYKNLYCEASTASTNGKPKRRVMPRWTLMAGMSNTWLRLHDVPISPHHAPSWGLMELHLKRTTPPYHLQMQLQQERNKRDYARSERDSAAGL